MNESDEKIALITGATSGLGAAYAKHFAMLGYNLVITGRRSEVINDFAVKLKQEYHVDVQVIIVELSNHEGLDILLKAIKDYNIDILVNNAGFGLKPYFADTDITDIERMLFLQTNVPVLLTRAMLPNMISKNSGVIINISSDGALLPMPKNVTYASTKSLLKVFSEGLHMELLDTGIKVQVVCPGFIKSHFHKAAEMSISATNSKGLMKFSEPEDIVKKSMKDLNNGKIICIPGVHTNLLVFILKLMPKKLYYKKMHNFVKSKYE